VTISLLDEIESNGEEVHDLLVCTHPYVLLAVLIEDQEQVDVERSVHQNVEVEPVGIGWLTDAEVVREAHTASVSVTTRVPTKMCSASRPGAQAVREAAPTQRGQLDALSTDRAATGGPRTSSGTPSRAVICATASEPPSSHGCRCRRTATG
jgi:hypothetical protein